MKILMIDDEKNPIQFFKEPKVRFKLDEVTLVKTYSEGMDTLLEQGPWDILLLDWNLNEFSINRNGLRILDSLYRYSGSDRYPNAKVDKIILITADDKVREEMRQICIQMKTQGFLKAFEAQANGQILFKA